MKVRATALAILMTLSFVLTACAPSVPETVEQTDGVEEVVAPEVEVQSTERVKIGYAAPSLVGGQQFLQDMIMRESQARGWEMITTNANGSPQKQNDDIDYMLSLGVDAIITVPEDSAAICSAVEKAKEAGVFFFTADRSPSGCAIDMVVQSNNRQAGSQAGEVMVASLIQKYDEPKGKVLEITGNLGQNVGQQRRDGFHDVLDKEAGIEVIQKVADWDAARAQQIVRDVLNANPDLDGIYLHSEVVYGSGVQSVLEELNRWKKVGDEGHIIITGVDGGPWLLKTIWDGYGEGIGSQPSRYFSVVTEFVDLLLKDGTIEEGEFVKEGALWSPATVVKNDDGTSELLLGTLKVTCDNIANPETWSYWNSELVPPEGTPAPCVK